MKRLMPEPVRETLARVTGFFWLPCPVCGEHFAGYEWRDVDSLPSTVPNLERPGSGSCICPICTAKGYGYPMEVSYEIWESA